MAESIGSALKQSAPWRRGIAWWLVLVEGIIIVGIGLFLIIAPDSALSTVRGILGGFLVFNSVLGLLSGLRGEHQASRVTQYRLARGGIGLLAGLMVVLQPIFDYVDAEAARTILGVGLLLWGALGLLAIFTTFRETGMSWSALILSGIAILFAVLIFTNDSDDHSFVRPLGVIALIIGGILLAYSYLLRQSSLHGDSDVSMPL